MPSYYLKKVTKCTALAMIEGLGFVFTPSGMALSWKRALLRTAVSWLYRVALVRAHQVIFLNRDDISDFVKAGLVDEGNVQLLGGIGVDLGTWPVAQIAKTPITFILAARLLREKGILEYAAAATRLPLAARAAWLGPGHGRPSRHTFLVR
ncbi:MAG: hypothetical protein PSV24_01865 [Rhodoferax sp.]|nr:hypothetical protein [Rhodoferax sp.]